LEAFFADFFLAIGESLTCGGPGGRSIEALHNIMVRDRAGKFCRSYIDSD
jgi:hypothetical protein